MNPADIVKRLRECQFDYSGRGDLIREAAMEIERLRKERHDAVERYYRFSTPNRLQIQGLIGEVAEPLRKEIERLRKVMKQMAEGWSNALELDLLPPQHRMSATILRDAAWDALKGKQHEPG